MKTLLLVLVLALAAFPQTSDPSAALSELTAPRYILSSGVSFDAVQRQSSSVSTLAVKIAEPGGLPTYQATTWETAIVRGPTGAWQLDNSATVRAGLCQTLYQRGFVALGGCSDIGVMKAGDQATLGTVTGAGWLGIDIGAKLTGGKRHVYIIPTVRWIAINGVQIKPSYAFRVGTGF